MSVMQFVPLPGGLKLQLVKTALLVFFLSCVLVGIVTVGRNTRDDLKQHDRFAITFAEIEVEAPPGEARDEFLLDVQYYGAAPDKLLLLDETLPGRLAALFNKHPMVDRVDKVEMTPPRRVTVKLTYRRAVLAVHDGMRWRAVDAEGVVLSKQTPITGLPTFQATRPPSGPEGSRWGDPAVENAAREAGRGHFSPRS